MSKVGRVGVDCSVSKEDVIVFIGVGIVLRVGDEDEDQYGK